MKNIIGCLTLLAATTSFSADVCEELRAGILSGVNAGASVMTISKGADQLYPIVSTSGQGAKCKYLRYAFRALRKPYNGDSVSPKEWEKAIQKIRLRREY